MAEALRNKIEEGHKNNRKFIRAFNSFAELCRTSLDPKMSDEIIDNMLVQHLLTERLFRTVFDNPDFVRRNAIAAEIDRVIDALVSNSFNRTEFLKSLDRFYIAIEGAAKDIKSWGQRQSFLNKIYERFFQGFSTKQADTYGVVYTPQEIVDFMVDSVDKLLKRDFGKSIETPGVKILDPATGTGNFMVNLISRIQSRGALHKKYTEDLFCNEIMLLPYYIASLNIEHEYYARMGQYEPFDGICFADTLELAEGKQLSLFVEENTERVKREKEADIMVVIGNPPYNAWQKRENDNNKNRKYPVIDGRIRNTYVRYSKATNKSALSDLYVKFFRWATDRLQGQDGIVTFVSNNSFLDGYAFDGFRKLLAEEFTHIFHLDLGGNAREKERGNVFDIMVGVGITFAIRKSSAVKKGIYYYRVPDNYRKQEKLGFLKSKGSIEGIDWIEINPDQENNWIHTNGYSKNAKFFPLGTKDVKAARTLDLVSLGISQAIFKTYSPGVQTNRDVWVYDFNATSLSEKVKKMLNTYNAELVRWGQEGKPKDVDSFVLDDESKIKWSSRLKELFVRGTEAKFHGDAIREALYRPFVRKYLYFDNVMIHRPGLSPLFFPTPSSENRVICVPGIGDRKGFGCFITSVLPDLELAMEKIQCFPFYIYSKDGHARNENITEGVLKQFQSLYGSEVTKWDIFNYVYGILHHPQYRDLYKDQLKRDVPYVPLMLHVEAFEVCVSIGEQLADMHINYEAVEEYPLRELDNGTLPFGQLYSVEKMKLSSDKSALIVNRGLTLEGLPPECFEYRLGNRSALEWVIDQYQVSTDKRSGIESNPNRLDEPEYIVSLVKKVITVSIKTVELVKELAEAVTAEDWLGEQSIDDAEETA